nr:hypothetical protein [Tanacetum cinerariifolium]
MMTALKMVNMREDRAAVRAEIEVLRRERLSYEQESIQIREALTKPEAYSKTLEALEAGARIDILEDTGVVAAMAEAEASRVKNGYDNNGLGPRLAQAIQSDRVEKYIGGLPNTIHDSVKATRPKTMQEAIEFATELMDRKIVLRGVGVWIQTLVIRH